MKAKHQQASITMSSWSEFRHSFMYGRHSFTLSKSGATPSRTRQRFERSHTAFFWKRRVQFG